MRFAPCSGAAYRACGWRRGRSCWTRAGACCSSPRRRRSCRGWRARRCLRTACRWRRSCVAAGRADQFALAALFYWLLCGRWPSIACPESDGGCRYEPLGERQADLPVGWDGVLARALAPRPEARFEALSEFWLALQKPLAHSQRVFAPRRLQRGVLALVLLLAGAALLVGLAG